MNWKKKMGLFLSSQAISLFGSSLVQYAIIWYITLKTGSGIMMTLATLCGFLPQVFISLFAGVWADKYNKKKLIMMADGVIALSTFIIAILFFMGFDNTWLLFVVLAIRSLGSGVQTPTTTSFIPEVVPEDKLMRVNGINTTIQSIMMVVSPAASGALLASIKLEYIFFIDVLTAVIGIFIFSFVKVEHKKHDDEKIDYFASIKEGIGYVMNHKLIKRLMIYLIIANILVTPLAIMTPLLVTRTFGADPLYLTVNEMVFFIGNIVGGVILTTWGGFDNRIKTVGLASFVCSIFSIFMGLAPNFILYLVFAGLVGLTMPMFNTTYITLFQEHVDADKQGRVFSLVSIAGGTVMPLSMVIFGPLADIVRIEHMIIVTGIFLIVLGIILIKDKLLKSILEKRKI